ncbi:MAG: hypothetical protein F4233_07465 [Rhodospirillaceae bacterium]|nr:hypothetical protein [Rhodospirillaceae bacterium]
MNTYEKAVSRFLVLMDAPIGTPYTTPRSMAVAQALPPGSGARSVNILESRALLQRDIEGTYLRGERAYRIGLSALGAGIYGGAVAPILFRLRRATDQTAFLGMLATGELTVGPHAIGRGALAVGPKQAGYRCRPRKTRPNRGSMLWLDISDAKFGVVALPLDGIPESPSGPVVGLMVATGFSKPVNRGWEIPLEEARNRFLDAVADRSAD